VEGREDFKVIIEDQKREIFQSLIVQGQKLVSLAIEVAAQVAFKLGNMVVPIEVYNNSSTTTLFLSSELYKI
jgi:hypothetical protein